MKKDQDELNLLKRKLLANHEQQNILLAQQELNKLKISAAGDFENLHGNSPKPGVNQRAARLMDERKNLMQTGAYFSVVFWGYFQIFLCAFLHKKFSSEDEVINEVINSVDSV